MFRGSSVRCTLIASYCLLVVMLIIIIAFYIVYFTIVFFVWGSLEWQGRWRMRHATRDIGRNGTCAALLRLSLSNTAIPVPYRLRRNFKESRVFELMRSDRVEIRLAEGATRYLSHRGWLAKNSASIAHWRYYYKVLICAVPDRCLA